MHPVTEWIVSNSVVALGLALLALFVSRTVRTPALAHLLWLLVLIKLITPPLFRFPVELTEKVHVSPQSVVTAIVDENILAALPLESFQQIRANDVVSIEVIVIAIWISGSVTWLLLAGFRSSRFSRRLKGATAMEAAGRASANMIAGRLHLKSLPDLVLIEGKVPPLLWAFFGRATIAIPAGLWTKLSSEERETLLAHELAHFRRRDHWYRWIEWSLLTVLWWHPLVWFARLGLRKAEEDSCDAWVLWTLPNAAKDYASAILKTLDFLSKRPASMPTTACGFAERRSFKNVKDRFTTILKHKPSHAMNKKQKTFTIALAVLVLPLSGFLIQNQVTANEGEGPTEAEIAERQKVEKQQSEIQAMQVSVEQRLAHLEKIVEKLVEQTQTEKQPTTEHIVRQRNQLEQQQLHKEHYEHQLALARREAMIEETRMEAELSRRQTQLEIAKQQHDEGRIQEQELLHLEHEVRMSELHAEQEKVTAERRLRDLEMQLKHQELVLKQLERNRKEDL